MEIGHRRTFNASRRCRVLIPSRLATCHTHGHMQLERVSALLQTTVQVTHFLTSTHQYLYAFQSTHTCVLSRFKLRNSGNATTEQLQSSRNPTIHHTINVSTSREIADREYTPPCRAGKMACVTCVLLRSRLASAGGGDDLQKSLIP